MKCSILALAIASLAFPVLPVHAGPAQRYARQMGISIREARQRLSNRASYTVGPAAPGSTGSVYIPYNGPSIGPALGTVVGQ